MLTIIFSPTVIPQRLGLLGTFGLWGALLSGGQVVLPKQIMEVKEGLELEDAGLLGNDSGWHLL